MSATPTPLHDGLLEYVAAHARAEDGFTRELKAAAAEAGFPAIWISPEQSSLMTVLLRACGARRVVEVGTLAGVSALALARALPPAAEGGRLVTIELDPERARFARDWIARTPFGDRVEVRQGPGDAVLATLEAASFDAAFVDADKGGYERYLDHCRRLLRPGGLLLVDNAFAFGQLLDPDARDPDVEAVRRFNERMAREPGFEGIIVPVGDGLWVAVRNQEAR